MNKSILLIKAQLKNLFHKSRKKSMNEGIAPLLITAGAVIYISVMYTNMFLEILPDEIGYYVLYLMTGCCVALLIIMGVTTSQGMLFGFKDFDFLSALPITKRDIVISKISTFLIYEYLYAAGMMLPCILIYGVRFHASALFYLFSILGTIAMPLIPIAIASLIGLLVKGLSSKSRHKSMMSIAMTFVFLIIVFMISFGMGSKSEAQNIQALSSTAELLHTWLPSVAWYIDAAINENALLFLLAAAINIGVMALFIWLMSPVILKVGAAGDQGYHVKNFRLKRSEKRSVQKALFQKEASGYFGSPAYVGNTLLPAAMMLIAVVYVVFNRSAMQAVMELGLPMDVIWLLIIVCFGLMVHSCTTTGVSISLEGNKFWILQTLPLNAKDIFKAKLFFSMTVQLVPTIIGMVIVHIALGISLLYLVIGIVYLIAVALFSSLFGLCINLRFPKLQFDREIIVIKQSASSMITIFANLGIGLAILFISINLVTPFSSIGTAAFLLAAYILSDLVMIYDLNHRGLKRFLALN